MRRIVKITLDCGHTRTWDVDVGIYERYGYKEKVSCKECEAPELVHSIINKAVLQLPEMQL